MSPVSDSIYRYLLFLVFTQGNEKKRSYHYDGRRLILSTSASISIRQDEGKLIRDAPICRFLRVFFRTSEGLGFGARISALSSAVMV